MWSVGQIDLRSRVDQAISRLMSAQVEGETARISVPVFYPSGSGCTVEVILNGDKCFISDMGIGYAESEMHGAHEFYAHAANVASERFGVGFDGLSIFAAWAPLEKIETAIAGVANASAQAASSAIFRAVEEKEKQRNNELFVKIAAIFGEQAVAKKAEITGRDAAWEAHNVVSINGRPKAIFEFVNKNQNSIASKFMMFSDLARMDEKYSLNSVVANIELLGKKGSMLADVSNVIPFSAASAEFLRYAKVA